MYMNFKKVMAFICSVLWGCVFIFKSCFVEKKVYKITF